jgi:hypothetical protein
MAEWASYCNRPAASGRDKVMRERVEMRLPAKGVIVDALDANGGTAVTTKSLTSEKMEARVARFNKLQTYQRQNFERRPDRLRLYSEFRSIGEQRHWVCKL